MTQVSASPDAAKPPVTATAWRIRFTPDAPPGTEVLRRFKDPRPMVAAAQAIELADLPRAPAWPEPHDQIDVAIVPDSSPETLPTDWLAAPDQADAPRPISVAIEGARLLWRPGRALILGSPASPRELLCALAGFAFYESVLRGLEEGLGPYEARAKSDALLAYDIRRADRRHWPRFRRIARELAQLRLSFARLEPHLYLADRSLPASARRLLGRLASRAALEDRATAVNDRLEACEELYQDALDRITEHRGYRQGALLEITIIVLLAIEVLQIAAELLLHLSRG